MYPRVGEKRRIEDINLEDEEAIGSLCRLSGRPVSPKSAMEQEKRIRREIANSNERRRMQSINAGFASLKTLLPHHEGEKLSKAAILQQTAEYIYQLEQEKTRLLAQNCQLKRLLNQQQHSDTEGSPTGEDSPCEDRSLAEGTPPPPTSSVTTPVASAPVDNLSEPVTEELRREVIDTRVQLDRERKHRLKLEEHIRGLEAEVYPEKIKKDIAQQIKADYKPVKIEIDEEDIDMRSQTIVSELGHTEHIVYKDFGQDPKLPKAVTKPASAAVASRVTFTGSTTANLCSTNTVASGHSRTPAILTPPTTIVTVLPSNKLPVTSKALPSILELRDVPNVNISDVPSSAISSECISEHSVSPLNHTRVFIVNSTNSSCQKSLDTICEAIRHLEGDHMFPTEERPATPRIEEEVVTEETFTVEDIHHSVPQGSYDSQNVCHSPHINASVSNISHSLGGSMGHLTLHMVQPEPQEVPLELTTTHRANDDDSSQHYVTHDIAFSSAAQHQQNLRQDIATQSTLPATLLRHPSTTRPGVIVVKHT